MGRSSRPTAGSAAVNMAAVTFRVAGFPYSMAFVELENELRVIAIAHDKRKPGYWLTRLHR